MEAKSAIASILKVEEVQKAPRIHSAAIFYILLSFLSEYASSVLL